MDIRSFLKITVERDASDVSDGRSSADVSHSRRHSRRWRGGPDDHPEALTHEIMREKQRKEFEQNMEMNLVVLP